MNPVIEAKIRQSLTEGGAVLSASQTIEALLGYPAEDFLAGRVRLQDRIHPDDADIAARLFAGPAEDTTGSFNIRMRQANGRIRCLRGRFDKPHGGEILDLQLQDAKSLSQFHDGNPMLANFSAMMENTDDFIFFKDRNHVFTGASQTLVTITDPSEHWTDLIGQTDYDVFPEAYADIYYRLEKQVFAGMAVAREIQDYAAADGSKGWVDNRKYPLRDARGELVGLFGIARDITDKKLVEQALRQSEERFRRVFEQVPSISVQGYDQDRRVIFWNQASEKLYGYSREQALGKRLDDLIIPESMRPGVADQCATWLQGGPPIPASELTLMNARGEPVEVFSSHVMLRSAQGDPELYCIDIDIAERKQTEAALRQSELLLRTVLDEYPDPVLLKDHKGDFLLANRTLATMYGTTPEAMRGKSDGDFGVPREQADFFRDNVLEIMATGDTRIVYEDSRDAASGAIRHYRSIKKPLKDAQGHNQILVLAQDITDLVDAQAKIAESEGRLQQVMEITREGVWDWNIATGQVLHNAQWYTALGCQPGDIDDTVEAFVKHLHPEDRAVVWQRLDALLQGHSELYFSEHRLLRDDGQIIWVHDRGRITERDAQGKPTRIVGSFTDITERKQAQSRLLLAANVFTHAREGIMITDAQGNIVDVNDTFTRITGFDRQEVLGRKPSLLKSGLQAPDFYRAMWQKLLDTGHWTGEIWNRRKDGEVYAEWLTISAVLDDAGRRQHFVSLFSDITTQKEYQRQLEHIAHYDALTGLPNRVLLADRMHQAMVQSKRRGLQLVTAYLDLDGFKAVNDLHGHEIGDRMLTALAERFKSVLRQGDTMARLGGDEFIAVFNDLADIQASVPLILRLLNSAAQPVAIDALSLQVSASIGVVYYPQSEDVDADQLLRQADQAMYQVKLAGKNRYHIFDAELDRNVRGHHESLDRIRLALEHGEFVLYYQPKVNLRTGEIIGAEALIRWQHPQRGLLAPAYFLSEVEDHPLGIELGEWVLDTALSQIEAWKRLGHDLPVSVNIAAHHLQQPDFVERLQRLLQAHPEVQPGHLELEVLETSALEDMAYVSKVIDACVALGVDFALDDFGTGYSSLTYLKRLPALVLKIDQSFVRDMLTDPDDLAILEGVLGLAAAFGRQAIAEGVETIAHGVMLLRLGCELAQGYGIARPMPADRLPDWLTTWRPDPTWQQQPSVKHDDLPLLYATVEHRAWVAAIDSHLQGGRDRPLLQDHRQCRFSRWVDGVGRTRHAADPAYLAVESLHDRMHHLARDLLDLKARGEVPTALARFGELHGLRDQFLGEIEQLLARHVPLA